MKNYIIILLLIHTFCFTQESTGNIMEDHDKAVEGILSEQMKEQTKQINRMLEDLGNDVLLKQASYSFLGIVGTMIMESNETNNPVNMIPFIAGHVLVPILENQKIKQSNEPENLKELKKSRVVLNSTLGSIPFIKWYLVLFRTPKMLFNSIF